MQGTVSIDSFGGTVRAVLSIITVVRNALDELKRTVESVVAQPLFPDLEYIIIDGGSTDGTLSYLETLSERFRWISEPDAGIYDAMNKGMAMATGRGLLFLNAGDVLVGEVLTEGVPIPGFLPVRYMHPVFGYRSVPLRSRKQGLPNCHQGIIFENREGMLYDLKYRVSADYDFYLRFDYPDRLPIHKCKGYVDYDNSGFSKQQSDLRDREMGEIIRKKFGWFSVFRFQNRVLVKRIVRRFLSSGVLH